MGEPPSKSSWSSSGIRSTRRSGAPLASHRCTSAVVDACMSAYSREQPLQGSHLFGERQGGARRVAVIGEEHPRPLQVDRHHIGREARPSRRQIRDDHRLMTTERPSRLEEERPGRADGPQHRSPGSLLHALQPNDRTRALGDPALHLSQPHRSAIAQPRSGSHVSEPGSSRPEPQTKLCSDGSPDGAGPGTAAWASTRERP